MLPVPPSLAHAYLESQKMSFRQMQEDFSAQRWRSPVLYGRNVFAMCELNCRA